MKLKFSNYHACRYPSTQWCQTISSYNAEDRMIFFLLAIKDFKQIYDQMIVSKISYDTSFNVLGHE